MKKILLTIITGILFFHACDHEEYLDQQPHAPSDQVYTTEEGALQGLNAAYDILQLGEEVERIEFIGTICSGDAMVGGEPGGNDQPAMQESMKFQTRPDNLYARVYWAAMYRGIYRCNLLLSYISEPIDGFDDQLRQRIKGETLFLRGLYHFKLQSLYGGYPQLQDQFNNQLKGVPFIDKIVPQNEWEQERPELSYTWDRIEEDFREAADLLPLKSEYGETDLGRATQGAAQSMLAKTHLYQEEWEDAYTAAKEVIESGEYWLLGGENAPGPFTVTRLKKTGEVQEQVSGYEYLWQPEANNGGESIFSVQHHLTGNTTFPQNQEGNLVPQYYGPRSVTVFDENGEESETEYYWGFILPTEYFVETAYENIGAEDGDGNILDPRYDLSVVEPDDYFPYYYSDDSLRNVFPDSAQFNPWYNWPCTGYSTWKYFTDPLHDNNRGSLGDRPQNTKYLRFADLLLIGAEAALNSGNEGDALAWINRVRTRARNAGNTGHPENLTSVTNEDIWNERRVELAFEGHQFFDIVRTGRAEQVLVNEAMNYATMTNPVSGQEGVQQFGDNFQVGKNELYPIPQSEIDNTGGSITQNPNFE